MGVDDFGIFAEGFNWFTYEQVVLDELVTILVTYPFLFVAVFFFGIMYPIIDLYYLLSFNFTALLEKL